MNEMTLYQPISSDLTGSESDSVPERTAAALAAPSSGALVIINRTGEATGKLGEQLCRLGYEVRYLREDLDVLPAFDTVQTVILDWRGDEPKDRGFAEALAYQGAQAGVPILALAAASRVDDIQLAFEAGLSKLVTAPCQLGDIKAALEALARRRQIGGAADERRFNDSIALMQSCKFRFRTREDVEQLVPLIARIFPKSERAAPGIFELMMNAIEHGNLEIGFDQKAEWVARGVYKDELAKRLETPPFSTRWAEVTINRRADGVMIVIMDQGCGFCWQDLVENPDGRPDPSPEVQALSTSKCECFDKLRVNQSGNQVTAFVAKESLAW